MTNLYLKTSKKKNSRGTLTVKALVVNLKLILLLFFVHISAHHLIPHTLPPRAADAFGALKLVTSSSVVAPTHPSTSWWGDCVHLGPPSLPSLIHHYTSTPHPPQSLKVPLAKFSLPPSLLLPFLFKSSKH